MVQKQWLWYFGRLLPFLERRPWGLLTYGRGSKPILCNSMKSKKNSPLDNPLLDLPLTSSFSISISWTYLLFVGSPGSGTELQCTRIVEKYPGTVHIPLKAKVRSTVVYTIQESGWSLRNAPIFTDRVRSTRGGNIFSLCVCSHLAFLLLAQNEWPFCCLLMLCSGRYASCVHAGGLSCLKYFDHV